MFSKLEKEILSLHNTLESLKKEHSSLVNDNFGIFDTIEEKINKVECGTCPVLKLKIENLKVQLTHNIK